MCVSALENEDQKVTSKELIFIYVTDLNLKSSIVWLKKKTNPKQ